MTYDDFFNEWGSESKVIEATTSGSTGKPKKIYLSKQFVTESAERTNHYFSIDSSSRLHSCISPDYIGGKMMAVRALTAGATLTWEEPSNQPLTHIKKEEWIDLLAVVPSQMKSILERIAELPTIRNIIIGGAPIPESLRKDICLSGLNAYETYGMTETASHIALRKVSDTDIPFKAFDDIKISTDERDCLIIDFKNGLHIVTNDIVKLVNDREFYVEGRYDNVIITGGKKVNPSDLEFRLSALISSPLMVTSVADDKWGRKIILLIEGEPTRENNEIKDEISKLLLPFERPKEIYYIKKIPRTENGKFCRDENIIKKITDELTGEK